MILRGLVLKQPWAHACIFLQKDLENRGKPYRHRGPLVIVAGSDKTALYHEWASTFMRSIGVRCPDFASIQRGGIIGCVEMYDVVTPDQYPATKWHMPGQYGYRIRKAVPLPFRPLRGHQGLMRIEMTADEIKAIEAGGIKCEYLQPDNGA